MVVVVVGFVVEGVVVEGEVVVAPPDGTDVVVGLIGVVVGGVMAIVVVVVGVVVASTIWSVVAADGARGVTPAGSKAIVTRSSFTK